MADRLELGNKQPSLFETKTKTLTFFLNYTREEQRTPEYCDKVFSTGFRYEAVSYPQEQA